MWTSFSVWFLEESSKKFYRHRPALRLKNEEASKKWVQYACLIRIFVFDSFCSSCTVLQLSVRTDRGRLETGKNVRTSFMDEPLND